MATDARRAARGMEEGMDYSDLVRYYKDRMMERYRDALDRPELQEVRERLEAADSETLREVMALLKK